jgi:hypothetical protein
MVEIDVTETSGVDHPAHLTEGWVVMKSATPAVVEGLFGSLNTMKGTNVPEKNGATETVEDLQKQVAALTAERDEAVAKAAAAPAPAAKEQTPEELLKSADLPPAVRDMLEKSARETEELRKQAAQDRADFAKERDARLDVDAIAKSKDMFKAVAINHGEVAPALRRMAMVAPDVAKSIETALAAADAQLAESGLFTEVGTVAKSAGTGVDGVLSEITAAGEELRKSDSSLTAEAAFAKALQGSPELQTRYFEAQKGA